MMSVPGKVHNSQLAQIQLEERLAATSEVNPASCLVTGCGEGRGIGYGAETHVKGSSHTKYLSSMMPTLFT